MSGTMLAQTLAVGQLSGTRGEYVAAHGPHWSSRSIGRRNADGLEADLDAIVYEVNAPVNCRSILPA